MTTPAGPGTGAGGQSATDASQLTNDQNHDGQQGPQPGTGDDWSELTSFFSSEGLTPGQVRERLNASRKWEQRSKENYEGAQRAQQLEQQLTAMKQALGLESAEQLPEHVQQRLAAAERAQVEAEERAAELAYQTTVNQVATTAGLDAEALLDSGAFRQAVADELDDDGFDDADLLAAVQKVAKEFSKRSRFAGGRPSSRSGGEFNGAPGGTKPVSEEELARMTPEQVTKALEEGRLNHLL